uniref:Uncharacterized protein n=1 Tax=Neovison vison TaxID=452646 RepID=A0A8C7BWL4_NEOVI
HLQISSPIPWVASLSLIHETGPAKLYPKVVVPIYIRMFVCLFVFPCHLDSWNCETKHFMITRPISHGLSPPLISPLHFSLFSPNVLHAIPYVQVSEII